MVNGSTNTFQFFNFACIFQHCLAMFEELEDLQAHMYEHEDEVEEATKSDRATMVQKSRSKERTPQPVSTDETVESGESEGEEEEELDDSIEANEEDNCIVLSTEIVTVSSQ